MGLVRQPVHSLDHLGAIGLGCFNIPLDKTGLSLSGPVQFFPSIKYLSDIFVAPAAILPGNTNRFSSLQSLPESIRHHGQAG